MIRQGQTRRRDPITEFVWRVALPSIALLVCGVAFLGIMLMVIVGQSAICTP